MQTTSSQPHISFRALDADKILATVQDLHARLEQRLPTSGLSGTRAEIVLINSEAKDRADWLARPILCVRSVASVFVVLLASVIGITLSNGFLRFRELAANLSDLAQGIDAGVNVAILLSAAIYFLVTLERRMKRSRALKGLHEIRSLAHIIDMNQLTKRFSGEWAPTSTSPK